MKLSKQRMAAVGILSVAVLALGADRLLLNSSISGPAAAAATEVPAAAEASAASPLAEATSDLQMPRPVPRADIESVASRLRFDAPVPAAAEVNTVSSDDAFVIPASWLPKAAVEPSTDVASPTKESDAVTNFKATITAILGTQADPIVKVALPGEASKTVRLGGSVGGLELLRVNVRERTAVFGLSGTEKITLKLGVSNEQ